MLIAQSGRGRNRLHDRDPRLFLLTLQFSQGLGRGAGFLLALGQLLLRGSQIAGGRVQNLTIGVAFRRQRRQPLLGLRQFGLRRGRARHQFRAALLVVTPLGESAVRFQLELAQALAVLAHFGLDGVAALGAFAHARTRPAERFRPAGAFLPRWN